MGDAVLPSMGEYRRSPRTAGGSIQVDARVPFVKGWLVDLWAHLKIPEGSHGGCRNHSIGSVGSVPPSMGSHSCNTRMGLGYDWQICADPLGARTMASIVLILSHPLLGHPEATV